MPDRPIDVFNQVKVALPPDVEQQIARDGQDGILQSGVDIVVYIRGLFGPRAPAHRLDLVQRLGVAAGEAVVVDLAHRLEYHVRRLRAEGGHRVINTSRSCRVDRRDVQHVENRLVEICA